MKKYTIIILSFLFICLFFAYGLNAQHGIVVFGKDTLCINNINLDNISHGEEGVSFVCNDTILTRSIADVDSISIMKIPECIVIEQGIDDWSEMRLCSDGTVALTKMENENTPLEMMMMCPSDSLGAVFSKITFDENAYPIDITMNEYKLLVDWTDETQFNLSILFPDSISIRIDSLTYIVEQKEQGMQLVPDIDKKPWLTRLGGIFEVVGGSVAIVSGAALILGSGAAEVFSSGSSTPISVPGIAVGAYAVRGGINSLHNGWINAFTNDYVNGRGPIVNTLASQAATTVFERGVVPNLPNALFPYLVDSKYKVNDLYAFIPTALGDILINLQKPYTWYDLAADVQSNVLTGTFKDVTNNSVTVRGYINPYILESPSIKFETEYGILVYSVDDPKEKYVQTEYNGEGGMIEYSFLGLKPGTTYNYFTYYYDKTNYIYAKGKEKSFRTLRKLPVKITNFKQTDSHYKENGYTYNGWTYSYKFDVTVTVELTDAEGVADWGYVYEDPNGKIARISLKDFSSPYSDSRYVYYRNEAKSAVRLYEYVKFEGSEEYEYGEPVDYEVQHTLKVITGDVYDITETTAIVSGKIEGLEYSEVEDAGICYKDIELDNWERMSAQEVVGGYFSVLVSDLQSNTTYSYYAYATIDGVYYDGEVKEFTTKTSLPIITSFDVIDLTNTSATFSIFMEGINETVEDVGIWYSESYEDEDYEWVSANMNSDGYYVVQVNGLHNNTKYIYNAYAIIDGWVNIWTDDKVFTTNYCPDNHHPHAIDLGLPSGTKWACCNVGANSPGEYGGYYAWGETEEKDHYDLYNYAYYIPTYNKFIDLGKNIAGTEVDVAHVKWGGSWRMPSMLKIQELINNCDIKWGNTNGLNGMLIIGPNGNTIFLPRSHYQSEDEMEIGEYWSSSYEVLVVYDEYLDTYRYYYDQAYALEFGSGEYTDYGDWWQGHYTYRYWGQYVRPVCY